MAHRIDSIIVNADKGWKAHVLFDSRRHEYGVQLYTRSAPANGWQKDGSIVWVGEDREEAMNEAGEFCPQGEWQ